MLYQLKSMRNYFFVAIMMSVILLTNHAQAAPGTGPITYATTVNDAITGDNTPLTFTHPNGNCTNCWQPDLTADKYTKDLYERPMGSGTGASTYVPGLDITSTLIGADAVYLYFRINMFPTNPTPNASAAELGLLYSYAWEINIDGADGGGDARADFWVNGLNPRDNIAAIVGAGNWSNKAVSAYLDKNNDTGGTSPLLPQGPGGAGNGFELEVFKEGANAYGLAADSIMARILTDAGTNGRSLELAISRAFLARVKGHNAAGGTAASAPIAVTSASFRGEAGDGGAGTNSANLLLHDKFGRLSGGSPYPWLSTAPGITCPDLDEVANGTTTANQTAFDSGSNTLTATVNTCYPHGGNIFRFDNSGGVDDLASGVDFFLDSVSISGTVFEDVNYGGGAGRPLTASGAVARPNVRVELYSAAGVFLAFTTTNALGNYTFAGRQQNVAYTVRVVNNTVTSSRIGAVATLIPVQTFHTNGLTGAVGVPDTARVGGETPALVDAASNTTSATLLSLTTATTTAQSISVFSAGTVNITGINFGFNFDTIVNVNNAGQGSLSQFITNANTLGNDTGLAQAGSRTDLVTGATSPLDVGVEQSIFMISSSLAVPGLRAGLTNLLTSGRAIIPITTALPTLSASVRIEGGTQTFNVGNTNNVALGTGGTVGVGAIVLPQINGPEVELRDGATGAGGLAVGFNIGAINVTVRGMAVVSFGGTADSDTNANILIGNFTGALISQNVLGATALSFADPGATLRGAGDNLRLTGGTDTGIITNNLIGYSAGNGIATSTAAASTGWALEYNEVRGNGVGATARNGIEWDALAATAGANILRFNLIAANTGAGIELETDNADNNLITQNTLTANGNVTEPGGLRDNGGDSNTISLNIIHTNTGPGLEFLTGALTNIVSQNIIHSNTQSGIEGDNGSTSNTFTQNSIYANTRIGIDLLLTAQAAIPVAPYYTQNDNGDADTGANGVLNFPQIASVSIIGANTTITGIAPAGATIEFFISDSDASGFGEGQTYLVTRTEGVGEDAGFAGTGASAVTCGVGAVAVTMNSFSFTFPTPNGVVGGTSITSTSTLTANTSEFSCNVLAIVAAPSLVFLKTVAVFSDPFNGTNNPKNIPGAEVDYTLRVTNTGTGTVTNDSIVITDPIPANTDLFVGDLAATPTGSPVAFVNSTTPLSGISLTFTALNNTPTSDDVEFFSDIGCTVAITPTAPYDPTVRCLRINPKGTMAAASSGNNPFFDLRFRVRIK